jgi:hypothetical protein
MIRRASTSEWKSFLSAAIFILMLGGATVGTLTIIEVNRLSHLRAQELAYLPKGEYLRVAVLGYRQIAADLIWLEVLQHFGLREQTTEGYLWAYHATDVLTDLDPNFVFAYQAGGTVLSVWAKRPHESVALLKKGIRHNPQAWILPFLLGYNYYFELHDPKSAGRYFRMAAMLPGSPNYLPDLAIKMSVESGDPDAALEFLQRLYQQVKDDRTKEGLRQRMKEVIVERDIRFLEEKVRQYQQRVRKLPTGLDDLVTAGIVKEIPNEPLGGVYWLNSSDGSVSSTGLSTRLHIHRR